MPLTVLPATEADAAASIAVENKAYAGGSLDGILYTGPFPADDSSESRPAQLAHDVRTDPTIRFVKVEDTELTSKGEEGRIAFAKWHVKDQDWKPKEKGYGPGANVEACDILFGEMGKAYNERWIGKAHVYFKLLHTDPQHQGRGAGSLLLKRVGEEADRLGLPAYLEATEVAKPLYEKFGFVECGQTVGDFTKWGGPKEHVNYLMLRSARS